MRIKLFENFDKDDDRLKKSVESLFIELIDEGYIVNVSIETIFNKKIVIEISNSDNKNGIWHTNISEYFEILLEYLELNHKLADNWDVMSIGMLVIDMFLMYQW